MWGPGLAPDKRPRSAEGASLGSLAVGGQTCASRPLRRLRLKRPNYKVIRTALLVAVDYLITHWTSLPLSVTVIRIFEKPYNFVYLFRKLCDNHLPWQSVSED